MRYQIIYTESYNKRAAKFLKKHPQLCNQYRKTLELLEVNPYHPSLRFHQLQGKLDSLCSVSINISYRITLEFMVDDGKIIPIDVGSHDWIY